MSSFSNTVFSKLIMLIVLAASFTFLSNMTEIFAQTAPTQPINLQATPISATKIQLTWQAPTNNGTKPITGYKIEVKMPPSDFSALVANTGNATTKYIHSGVITGKNYVYRVSAISADGTSPTSIESIAKTTSTLTVTNPPGNLTATAVASNKVELSWLSPPNYGGPPITGYKIERKGGSSSGFSVLVSSTNSTSTKYTDSTAVINTQYTYRIFAINFVGASNTSNEAIVTPTAQSAPPKLAKVIANQTASNTSTKPIKDPIAAAKAEMQKKIDEARKSLEKRAGKEDSDKAKAAREEAKKANEKAAKDALATKQKLIADKQAALKAQQNKTTDQTVKQKPIDTTTQKPKTLEEARKLAEEAKQKALEEAQIKTTPENGAQSKKEQEMAAAKAAAWEKAKKVLEAAKAKSQK